MTLLRLVVLGLVSFGSFLPPVSALTTPVRAPVVLYTDIASGPNSGGENDRGAYLSVFGKNFGPIGLGTALSDYVRQVGVSSNFTVHLVLDEAPTRLPVDAETELLRIAQEAITNARKHANAENLWVTCMVNPPRATLRIEDDGGGLGKPRNDSFGLEVMRERAERVGARLTVQNREDGGTTVEVTLGARNDG